MITKDIAKIKQAKEVIEGQLININIILGSEFNSLTETGYHLIGQSFRMIELAILAISK